MVEAVVPRGPRGGLARRARQRGGRRRQAGRARLLRGAALALQQQRLLAAAAARAQPREAAQTPLRETILIKRALSPCQQS